MAGREQRLRGRAGARWRLRRSIGFAQRSRALRSGVAALPSVRWRRPRGRRAEHPAERAHDRRRGRAPGPSRGVRRGASRSPRRSRSRERREHGEQGEERPQRASASAVASAANHRAHRYGGPSARSAGAPSMLAAASLRCRSAARHRRLHRASAVRPRCGSPRAGWTRARGGARSGASARRRRPRWLAARAGRCRCRTTSTRGSRTPGDGRSPAALDVTDAVQIARAAARVRRPGGLDALVNNAGIGIGGPLEVLADGRPAPPVRRQRVRPDRGHAGAAAGAAPRRAGGSSSSPRSAAAWRWPSHAPYAASKHAIEALGDALRVELHSSSVQVALIEPGSVATPIWDKSRAEAERVRSRRSSQAAVRAGARGDGQGARRHRAARRPARAGRARRSSSALTARRMRARYVVGRDARAMLAARRLLPDHVFDRMCAGLGV